MTMNKEKFTSVYKGLLKHKGLSIDDDDVDFAFECMKEDFTDQQFRTIAIDIYKKEKLYNSIDIAPLFYKKLKELPAREDIQAEIKDLIEWIPSLSGMLSYSSNEEIENFVKRKTTDRQQECFRLLGGVVDFVEKYKKEYISFLEVRNKIDEVMRSLSNYQNRLSLQKLKANENLIQIGFVKEKEIEKEVSQIENKNVVKLPFTPTIKKMGV